MAFTDLVHRHLTRQLHQQSQTDGVRGADLYPLATVWEEAQGADPADPHIQSG